MASPGFGKVFLIAYANLSDDYSAMRKACRWFPENWEACIQKAQLESDEDKYDQAANTLSGVLKAQPNNYFAIGMMADLYLERKDYPNACVYVERYLKIWPGNNDVSLYRESCRKYRLNGR